MKSHPYSRKFQYNINDSSEHELFPEHKEQFSYTTKSIPFSKHSPYQVTTPLHGKNMAKPQHEFNYDTTHKNKLHDVDSSIGEHFEFKTHKLRESNNKKYLPEEPYQQKARSNSAYALKKNSLSLNQDLQLQPHIPYPTKHHNSTYNQNYGPTHNQRSPTKYSYSKNQHQDQYQHHSKHTNQSAYPNHSYATHTSYLHPEAYPYQLEENQPYNIGKNAENVKQSNLKQYQRNNESKLQENINFANIRKNVVNESLSNPNKHEDYERQMKETSTRKINQKKVIERHEEIPEAMINEKEIMQKINRINRLNEEINSRLERMLKNIKHEH